MTRLTIVGVAAVLSLAAAGAPAANAPCAGQVIDAASGKPIADAVVTSNDVVTHTDTAGRFEVAACDNPLGIRAPGYARRSLPIGVGRGLGNTPVTLEPFTPKALYLSFFGIGERDLRDAALATMARAKLNALVIDVKGDRGMIPYRSDVKLAGEIGADRIRTVPDIDALLRDLHRRGIYTIARIVVFKDNPLATARPDLAVHVAGGKPFVDREGLRWIDPFQRQAWEYNIDIAEEAARKGFDEIQFDYVRFPDTRGVVFSQPSTAETRTGAIVGFLKAARKRLAPYNVFISADIFGYVCWNRNDTRIGQNILALAPVVDYIAPMLYPSTFQFGIPDYKIPVRYPFEVVYRSLQIAARRTGIATVRFRPWLQAFKDYAFDRRSFGEQQIGAQIRAANQFGSDGWMLWNPRNQYHGDGIPH